MTKRDGRRAGPARVQAYADWHGRTPTAEELATYETEGRQRRRVRDLTHAIRTTIKRRPELAEKLEPRELPDGRYGIVLDAETRAQARAAIREDTD